MLDEEERDDAWIKGFLYGSAHHENKSIWAGLDEFKNSRKKKLVAVQTGNVADRKRFGEVLSELRGLLQRFSELQAALPKVQPPNALPGTTETLGS